MLDMNRVNSLLKNDQIWPAVACDRCDLETFMAPDDAMYLGAYDGDINAGFFIIYPVNSVTVEIHTIIDPCFWGRSIEFTKQVIDWIFTETNVMKIITFIPEYNLKAKRLAEKSGMVLEGVVSNSFLKDGELKSQFLYGVSK